MLEHVDAVRQVSMNFIIVMCQSSSCRSANKTMVVTGGNLSKTFPWPQDALSSIFCTGTSQVIVILPLLRHWECRRLQFPMSKSLFSTFVHSLLTLDYAGGVFRLLLMGH
ncbi:hypothetical protein EDC04DRAFT_2697699 [Pisolithus marmoratus]|nr:hypothetical protein EDC04DRAFT_2697699 [Pisolithus marmoratus]